MRLGLRGCRRDSPGIDLGPTHHSFNLIIVNMLAEANLLSDAPDEVLHAGPAPPLLRSRRRTDRKEGVNKLPLSELTVSSSL